MNALTRPTLTPEIKTATADAVEEQVLRRYLALVDLVGFTDTERRLQRVREEASRRRRVQIAEEGWIA